MMMKISASCLVCCGITAALLTSCVDFDDATHAVSTRVQLSLPTEFTTGGGLGGHDVTLQFADQRHIAQTDDNGIATFQGLTPDVYDISCSWKITAEEYHTLTGDPQAISGATVSGSVNQRLISQDGETVTLPTSLSIDRDIIIGKIFYAGSKDLNNRTYMAGKYVELYNQSDDSVDVSGLYIGLVEAESTQAYTLENLHEDYADSVILLKQVFRIPADANHRVKPGGTVLLVNSAIDHTPNDTLESNLLDADFEAKDYSSNPVQNNPATPALELIYSMYPSISVMNLVQSGPCGVVIFRTDDDVAAWPKTYPYGKTAGNQWLLCPKRHIIDGVECLRLTNKTPAVDVGSKRLYADIDAGYTNINAISGWNGEVVYRRTASLAPAQGDLQSAQGDLQSPHLILMDTNNSSNDFQTSTKIKPREYDQ